MKKKIDPRRIIQTVSQVFKPILGKHALRNMILTIIAISLSHKLRINEIFGRSFVWSLISPYLL